MEYTTAQDYLLLWLSQLSFERIPNFWKWFILFRTQALLVSPRAMYS